MMIWRWFGTRRLAYGGDDDDLSSASLPFDSNYRHRATWRISSGIEELEAAQYKRLLDSPQLEFFQHISTTSQSLRIHSALSINMQFFATLVSALPLLATASGAAVLQRRAMTAAQVVQSIDQITTLSRQLQPVVSSIQTGDTIIAKRQQNPFQVRFCAAPYIHLLLFFPPSYWVTWIWYLVSIIRRTCLLTFVLYSRWLMGFNKSSEQRRMISALWTEHNHSVPMMLNLSALHFPM